ncbi:TIGR03557 family F420-dependent LLM class oxidoreductase [Nocardioides sp. HB32]
MRIGYFLSCEEHPPEELVRQARLAADAGFEGLWISDHYHPWNTQQGQSPFVWSVIGAVAQVCDLPVTTAVTCPTVRIHPAVIAQAAATSARMCAGGFRLGVGSGEALNEHVTGSRWPTADVRLEMLEEAVEVIRRLLTGERVTHHGRHYTVEDARIYTLPDRPVEIPVSAFGPAAIELAARIGDGFVTAQPDAEGLASYRDQGGRGPAMAGAKACFGPDREKAQALAHHLWPNTGIPGELAQVLPSPAHFEQAAELVTPEMIGGTVPCGPDPDEHVEKLRAYAEAGFDELYVGQIGPDQEPFFEFYASEVLPALRRSAM